jgi:hypothetical protein
LAALHPKGDFIGSVPDPDDPKRVNVIEAPMTVAEVTVGYLTCKGTPRA